MSVALPRTRMSAVTALLLWFCIIGLVKDSFHIYYHIPSTIYYKDKNDLHHLVTSNSSEYTWIGNNFIPPKGVPMYQAVDYFSYFSKKNTLFLGDSTGRRAYGTLYGMMNHTDFSNIPKIAIDQPDVVNFGKPGQRQEECLIPGRHLLNTTRWGYQFVCRDIKENENTTNTNEKKKSEINNHKGRFDYMRMICYGSLVDIFNSTYSEALMDYDLIVLNIGIWEATSHKMCENPRLSGSHVEKYDIYLDNLLKNVHPNTQVVFRTPGFQAQHKGDDIIWEITNHAKKYSKKLVNNDGKFIIVDYGTVIAKRSFNADRLTGDIVTHYNLEARLLFLQQLLHELMASKEQYKR